MSVRANGIRRLVLPALVLLLGSCASAGGAGVTPGGGDRSRIEAEELAGADQYTSLLDAVRALRPQWLSQQRAHRSTAPGSPMVGHVMIYLDRTRLGGPETLNSISVRSVLRLQYFSPSAAQARYGNGHESGVIEVTTKSGSGHDR